MPRRAVATVFLSYRHESDAHRTEVRTLADALERVGHHAVLDQARVAFAEAFEIRRRLAALDPANSDWQRDANYSLHALGKLLFDEKREQEAMPLFGEALEISEKLAALDPLNITWQSDGRANRHWLAKARKAAGLADPRLTD